jgi:aryl-alcohol dehydrogenase-like predicted oxidoreductase
MLQGCRDEVTIATKFGRWLDTEHGGGQAAYVREATEASLKRLRTDRIDLMQMHIPDPDTPIEETLGALAELVAEGKIREIGCSNFSADLLHRANAAAEDAGVPRFVSAQEQYSLLYRAPETALIPECEASGVALLPWRPLFNGLLTGKYRPGEPVPEDTRIGAKNAAQRDTLLSPSNLENVAKLARFAEDRGHTILELAFAWLLAHPFVPTVIAGVSSPRQVRSNVAAACWTLTAADRVDLEVLMAKMP